jgi:hypothetical protein
VQTVMLHSTITLTLDTYGHLLPGQEADAVDGLGRYFEKTEEASEAMLMTGTDTSEIHLRPRVSEGGATNALNGLQVSREEHAIDAQAGLAAW